MVFHRSPVVVIDNGSDTVKAGLVSASSPSVVMPNQVATPHSSSGPPVFGCDADEPPSNYRRCFPVEFGHVSRWDTMESLLDFLLRQRLGVSPDDHPLLLTSLLHSSRAERERLCELVFESLICPALSLQAPSVLALAAVNADSGVVVDIGHSQTRVDPVLDGRPLLQGFSRLDLGGQWISEALRKGLVTMDLDENTQRRWVKDVKERFAFVRTGDEKEIPSKVTLPTGEEILIGEQLWRCAEVLFQPTELEMPGIHRLIVNSVDRCDRDGWGRMYGNVVIAGGSAELSGLQQRLEMELRAVAPSRTDVKVLRPPNCLEAVWVGGSVIATTREFKDVFASKEEYEEEGPDCVIRRTF